MFVAQHFESNPMNSIQRKQLVLNSWSKKGLVRFDSTFITTRIDPKETDV